jgi:hypothetical protein
MCDSGATQVDTRTPKNTLKTLPGTAATSAVTRVAAKCAYVATPLRHHPLWRGPPAVGEGSTYRYHLCRYPRVAPWPRICWSGWIAWSGWFSASTAPSARGTRGAPGAPRSSPGAVYSWPLDSHAKRDPPRGRCKPTATRQRCRLRAACLCPIRPLYPATANARRHPLQAPPPLGRRTPMPQRPRLGTTPTRRSRAQSSHMRANRAANAASFAATCKPR